MPERNGKQQESLIPIVSDEEAEAADFVVCCTADMPSLFDDNVSTTCAECGTAIYHRPSIPKKPKKICIECALKLSEDTSPHGEG